MVLILCGSSAFAGAYYSHSMQSELKVAKRSAEDIRQEMENKVSILGEHSNALHNKLKRCLNEKYQCCQ
jgi:uncharacterized protein YpuA (DUF1002 family)